MLEAILGLGIPVLAAIVVIFVVIAIIRYALRLYEPVPPNSALIVYGRRGTRVVTGGGTFILPVVEKTQKLDLSLMTIKIKADEVKTKTAVPVMIDWIAQIKVGGENTQINTASEVFLGFKKENIRERAQETLSGNLREIISQLTPIDVHRQRDKFVEQVQAIVADEMSSMGLELLSLTIQDVYDEQGYFENVAAKDIADTDRDARIARAEAEKTARTREADADREATENENSAQIKIALSEKERRVKAAQYDALSKTEEANAAVAFVLQEQTRLREVKEAEGQVAVVAKQKEIDLADEEAKRVKMALEATVKEPALAAAFEVETAAEASRKQTVIGSEANAKSTVNIATAEASATVAEGTAMADVTKLEGAAVAEADKAQGLAKADVTRADGEAKGDAVKAELLAQAEGERELAEARAAQDEINLRLEALTLYYKVQEAIGVEAARSLGMIGGNVKLVQFSGDTGSGSNNALLDLLQNSPATVAKINEMVRALSGDEDTNLAAIMDTVSKAVQGKLDTSDETE